MNLRYTNPYTTRSFCLTVYRFLYGSDRTDKNIVNRNRICERATWVQQQQLACVEIFELLQIKLKSCVVVCVCVFDCMCCYMRRSKETERHPLAHSLTHPNAAIKWYKRCVVVNFVANVMSLLFYMHLSLFLFHSYTSWHCLSVCVYCNSQSCLLSRSRMLLAMSLYLANVIFVSLVL